jgi:PAS domain S-box-containing protein
MLVMAPDGRLLRVNKAFCELVGHTEAELMGGAWGHLTHPDDMPRAESWSTRSWPGSWPGSRSRSATCTPTATRCTRW